MTLGDVSILIAGPVRGINLVSLGARRSQVTLETHYTPRNPIYALMKVAFMRRQFRGVCQGIVDGLKALTEARESEVAS